MESNLNVHQQEMDKHTYKELLLNNKRNETLIHAKNMNGSRNMLSERNQTQNNIYGKTPFI